MPIRRPPRHASPRWRTSCSPTPSSRVTASRSCSDQSGTGNRESGAGNGEPGAMKFSVVVFPGSNSDYDAFYAASHVVGEQAELVWHKDTDLKGADVVILPGGFAHGDYLRTGAIARFSPIMSAVKAFADRGGPVLGICNGFQILLEAGLLPGAMVRNDRIKFVSRLVTVRVEHTDTPFTAACEPQQVLKLPIAHGEGNYYAPPDVLDELEQHRQVIFRYSDPLGAVSNDH